MGLSHQKSEHLFQVLESIIRFGGFAGAIFIYVIAVLLFVAALSRYVFRSPIGFSIELSSLLLFLLTILAMGYTLQLGGHIRFSLLEEKLKGRARQILQLVSATICFVIFALFTAGGWMIFQKSLMSGWKTTDIGLPLPIVQWALPVGFGLLALQGLIMVFRNVLAIMAITETD